MTEIEVKHVLIPLAVALVIGILALWAYLRHLRNQNKPTAAWVRWFHNHQSHLLILFLVSGLMCGIGSTIYFAPRFLPIPPAQPTNEVVPLFNFTTILTLTAFFLTQILLFTFAFLFRTNPRRKAKHITGFLKLELTWTIIPAICFVTLFIWGQVLWRKISDFPKDNPVQIDVMGEQFSWHVRYPGPDHKLGEAGFPYVSETNRMGINPDDPNSSDDFTPVQMHIPVGQPIVVFLRSHDVIHSFFIPYFRVKMDAVPGLTTKVHFTATKTTAEMRKELNDPDFNYEVACAELCGRLHFAMKMILVVDTPEEYQRWYNQQHSWLTKKSESPTDNG